MADPFRAAATAYFVYGVVYLVGGLYLISQGVGVMGGPTTGATGATMLRWGLVGLVPLLLIPALLWRRWSVWGGWLSRRTVAWVVALLLLARAVKVAGVAAQAGASVPAPGGGHISFQAGALVFLVVTVAALAFVARAGIRGER